MTVDSLQHCDGQVTHVIENQVARVNFKGQVVSINLSHLVKLEQLYKANCYDQNYVFFLNRVFCMLKRYQVFTLCQLLWPCRQFCLIFVVWLSVRRWTLLCSMTSQSSILFFCFRHFLEWLKMRVKAPSLLCQSVCSSVLVECLVWLLSVLHHHSTVTTNSIAQCSQIQMATLGPEG